MTKQRTFILNGDEYRETYQFDYYSNQTGDIAHIEFENGKLKLFSLRKPETSKVGYLRIWIRGKWYLLHRLVYSAWGENSQNMENLKSSKFVIDHIDGNIKNNCANNLRLVTQSENIRFAIEKGTFGQCGLKAGNKPILVFDTVTNDTTIYKSVKDFAIAIKAPQFIIDSPSLYQILRRKEYKRYRVSLYEEGCATTIPLMEVPKSHLGSERQ